MTQEEILEYNKRCAEFLGFKYHEGSEYWTTLLWGGNGFTLRQMRFHSDWNWIMEVVEAIEDIKHETSGETIYSFDIYGNICKISTVNEEVLWVKDNSKKEAAVQAINQFLIWYNNEQRT